MKKLRILATGETVISIILLKKHAEFYWESNYETSGEEESRTSSDLVFDLSDPDAGFDEE